MALLEQNWGTEATVLLTAKEDWQVLRQARSLSVSGGQVCDAVNAASAEKAGASAILTWNIRHFARLAAWIRATGPGSLGLDKDEHPAYRPADDLNGLPGLRGYALQRAGVRPFRAPHLVPPCPVTTKSPPRVSNDPSSLSRPN